MRSATLMMFLLLTACDDNGTPGYEDLVKQVEGTQVGMSEDYWIEIKNTFGEWERTGLIFGYGNDYEACLTAIGGLKEINYAREYRCVPAN